MWASGRRCDLQRVYAGPQWRLMVSQLQSCSASHIASNCPCHAASAVCTGCGVCRRVHMLVCQTDLRRQNYSIVQPIPRRLSATFSLGTSFDVRLSSEGFLSSPRFAGRLSTSPYRRSGSTGHCDASCCLLVNHPVRVKRRLDRGGRIVSRRLGG